MEFSKVVFYGRLGEQALKMFGLEGELPRWRGVRLLDCPGGPGSLPALLRSHGLDVTAVDPLYALPPAELRQRALADLEHTMAIQAASEELRPDFDLQACRQEHLQTLELFLADREAHPEHYRAGALPELPFPDGHFDLVLSVNRHAESPHRFASLTVTSNWCRDRIARFLCLRNLSC